MQVGRFVGRLGIVAMPAVAMGMGLAERAVRRHVARLEAVGWLQRTAAVRGDGSLVWLTLTGLDGLGLTLPAVRAPAVFSATTHQTVQLAWAAADLERQGLPWLCARELAVERERWQIAVANERGGHSSRLPDLIFWAVDNPLPVAVVLERGQRNRRRERATLQGWQVAIAAGRYAQVRYQTGSVSARDLHRLAARIGLGDRTFLAGENMTAVDLAADTAEPEPIRPAPVLERQPAPARQAPTRKFDRDPPDHQHAEETPEAAAERQRILDELLGTGQPQKTSRWRQRFS
jgi:hypothetical protein